MMEIDSFLKNIYDNTKELSSSTFYSFFDEASSQSESFKNATKNMSEDIKTCWSDSVRIIFTGTANLVADQFVIFNHAFEHMQPIENYVEDFNSAMEQYIETVERVNEYEEELKYFSLPGRPIRPSQFDSVEEEDRYKHQLDQYNQNVQKKKNELEVKKETEERNAETCKNTCDSLVNAISELLAYHPMKGNDSATFGTYDNVDHEVYRDPDSGLYYHYADYYKDGHLVRRDYETIDGDCSSKGTKYYHVTTYTPWGDPVNTVKEDHIEYSYGFDLDGFTARANTKIENAVLTYDDDGSIISGTIGKYSYSKLPDENSDYWWNNVKDDVEIENYSFTMDPSVKTSNVSFFDYDNKYVLTTESYDSKKVVSDDGFVKITNGYNVERTSKNIRLSEHEDSVYEGKTEDGETTLEQVKSNYNYKRNSDGSIRATWDLKDSEEGSYIEYDSEGHCKNDGFARKETNSEIVENYRTEYNDNEKVVTIGSSTGKDTRSLVVEKDVKLVYSDDGGLSRKVGSVDLLTKDGQVGKTLEGITETYEKKKGMNVMTERTIDHVYHADGTVENNVHDYLVDESGTTTIIKSSAVESIVSSDGTIIATDVKRDYSNDNYYHEGTGTYGYENNGEQEGYVYCYGSLSSNNEPTVYYDNVRHYYYDDYGNLID